LLIFSLIIIIVRGPASGYEFSIYDAYPWYFWASLFAAIFCGQILIIRDIFNFDQANGWILGILAVILSNTVLLFLPLIRNYQNSGTGDVLTHIGFMSDILHSANVGSDQYPVNHILGVTLHFFTNVSLPDITMIIPPIFSLFFIVSIFLIGWVICPDKKYTPLFLLFGSVLYFGGYNVLFVPSAQAMLLLPLIFYLVIMISRGRKTKEFMALLSIISVLMVFFHPLITAICIIIFAIIRFSNIIHQKYFPSNQSPLPLEYPVFLMICIFSIWSTLISIATRTIEPVLSSLTGVEDQVSQFERYSDTVSSVSVDYWYLIKLAINLYGQIVIIGILSVICIGIIFLLYRERMNQIPFFIQVSGFSYLFFTTVSIVLFFVGGSSIFLRITRVALVFSLILIPFAFYKVITSEKINNKKTIVVCIILLIFLFPLTIISTNNVFDSPSIKESNQQVSVSDNLGMVTFFKIRDDSIPNLEIGLSVYRFYDSILGKDAARKNIFYGGTTPSDHFGYNTNTTLSEKYGNRYLILNNRGIFTYPNIFPEFPKSWRFTPGDFSRLKNDAGIQQIYQNGNIQVFEIIPV
jgi:hypothetical protein